MEAEFLCLLFCVSSISHLSNCLTPERRKRVARNMTGGEGHTHASTHTESERELEPQDEFPPTAGGPLARNNTKQAIFFSPLSGPAPHNQPSFFVFLCFCFLLTPNPLSMNHTNDNEEEQDLTAAAGEGNTKQAVNRTNIHKTRRIFYYS